MFSDSLLLAPCCVSLHARCQALGHILREVTFRHDKTNFEVTAEIGAAIVVRSVKRIFMLDAHGSGVAGILKHTEELSPIDGPQSRNSIAPPGGLIYRVDATSAQHGP